MSLQLPTISFLTIEAAAKRWKCSFDSVWDFIDVQKVLRVAVRSPGYPLVAKDADKKVVMASAHSVDRYSSDGTVVEEFPSYIYINTDEIMSKTDPDGNFYITEFQCFDFRKYSLGVDYQDQDQDQDQDRSTGLGSSARPRRSFRSQFLLDRDMLLLPMEEILRFEKEYMSEVEPVESDRIFEMTKLLQVLKSCIDEFWMPDAPQGPQKKVVVVEWLMENFRVSHGLREGMAKQIDTICRPEKYKNITLN
jgi:hypothetical protein